MIGLDGIRVIVVDNEPQDAMPIMKTLAREGIPTAYFDGELRGLPRKTRRLSGVRLAILDMDLVGGMDAIPNKAATLVNVVGGILSPDNGPYGVLAWTNHPDMVQEFERYLYMQASIPRPIFTMMITKAECKTRGRFDSAKIREGLTREMRNATPLLFLQGWEGEAFAACTEVTNILSGLASNDAIDLASWRTQWKTNTLALLRAVASSVAARQLDKSSCLSSVYTGLNPLHADRMESLSSKLAIKLEPHSDEILASNVRPRVGSVGKINTMLHLAFGDKVRFAGGNIYRHEGALKTIRPIRVALLIDDLFVMPNEPAAKTRLKAELMTACRSIVMEASAPCDHAQKNIRLARFVGGLLVPADKTNKVKRADFIWKMGPFFIKNAVPSPGDYYFCLSARHLFSLDLTMATDLKPFVRLRAQAFADMQSWFSHHASRPGMILLQDN